MRRHHQRPPFPRTVRRPCGLRFDHAVAGARGPSALLVGDRRISARPASGPARPRRHRRRMLLRPARSVHTMKMRFAIDIAHLDRDLVVLSTTTMSPWRFGAWSPRASAVIEAEAVRSAGGASARHATGDTRMTGVLTLVSTPIGNLGDLAPRRGSLRGGGSGLLRGHRRTGSLRTDRRPGRRAPSSRRPHRVRVNPMILDRLVAGSRSCS